MPELSRRAQRRQRHLETSQPASQPSRKPKSRAGRKSQSYPQDFATAGTERASRKNTSRDPKTLSDFEPSKGEGFGIGPGRGVESSASGLEGASNRERDYRGNAGTTFGAVVGPDALKTDTKEDDQRRPDPKPEA